jgi:hypothetical protein
MTRIACILDCILLTAAVFNYLGLFKYGIGCIGSWTNCMFEKQLGLIRGFLIHLELMTINHFFDRITLIPGLNITFTQRIGKNGR